MKIVMSALAKIDDKRSCIAETGERIPSPACIAETGDARSRRFVGAKNGAGVYQTIISQMPPHRVYIEAFAGTGAILRRKKAVDLSIAIDIEPRAIAALFKNDDAGSLSVICGDAPRLLSRFSFKGDELVYCDPPYLMSTRRRQVNYYNHEFGTEEEHARLLWVLRSLPCYVMISGYMSDLYARILKDWRRVSYQTATRAGPVTEYLWLNYPEPRCLHDYRFLGANFRERERIKRKKLRWVAKLQKMSALERGCLLAAISE